MLIQRFDELLWAQLDMNTKPEATIYHEPHGKKATVQLTLPAETLNRLVELSDETDYDVNMLAREAIFLYVRSKDPKHGETIHPSDTH